MLVVPEMFILFFNHSDLQRTIIVSVMILIHTQNIVNKVSKLYISVDFQIEVR